MSSLTFFTGNEGCTTSALGTPAIMLMGAKSRTVSNGTLLYTAGLLVSVLPGDTNKV